MSFHHISTSIMIKLTSFWALTIENYAKLYEISTLPLPLVCTFKEPLALCKNTNPN